jgi:ParB/RepB/Spo0J family partition protein
MPVLMSVDELQDAEQDVAQMREEKARGEREAREADLRKAPLADTASKPHSAVTVPLRQVRTMVNMRVGTLPDVHELAVSIKESGLLHPPLVRETGDEDRPYELLAGRRRFAAMQLLDQAEGPRDDWRFTLVGGISKREALTMQFAENFHQNKPEPVQFARAARAIMGEDESLTAADVSRLVGAPLTWTRKALRLLDLPESIVERVEQGDLSFTVADVVRRGIARGDVSAEQAEELVTDHAEGKITGGSLKLGVGYVPPKPKDYDEQSRKLDEARWAGKDRRPDDADQRDWDANSSERAARDRGLTAAPRSERRSGQPLPSLEPEDLDAYLLGLLLDQLASAERLSALGIRDEGDAHNYAFSLRPHERLGILRTLAAELLAADQDPPRALRSAPAAA